MEWFIQPEKKSDTSETGFRLTTMRKVCWTLRARFVGSVIIVKLITFRDRKIQYRLKTFVVQTRERKNIGREVVRTGEDGWLTLPRFAPVHSEGQKNGK